MTDRGAFLWLMMVCLTASAGVNLALVLSLVRPWWAAIRDHENGPRTVILRGTLRRRFVSSLLHLALIALFLTRVFRGQPAPPWVAAIVMLALIAGLIVDALGDMFDYRLLRHMFKARP